MKQQINLYQEQFHIKRVVLPAKQILGVTGFAVVFMLAVNGLLQWSIHKVNVQKIRLEKSQGELMQTNANLSRKVENQIINKQLQDKVLLANEQLTARQGVLEWVEQSQSEKRVLFSDLMEGLARRRVQGLWLAGLRIDQGGEHLQLLGNTVKPELLPDLLNSLKNESAYKGRQFYKVLISAHDDKPDVLRFLLTTNIDDFDRPGASINDWNFSSENG